jgi:uncharacterized protein (UPF0332 family)
MEAQEFLTSAQKLIQGNQEIDYQNAASRAYYCAFHLCRMLLEELPYSQGSIGASHEKVISELLSYPDKKLNQLGRKLEQAKRLRQKADYQLNVTFSRYEASRLLFQAQKISSFVDDYLKSFQDKS